MPELAQQLSEVCGPGMPGPYGETKEIEAASRDRNPSGAAAPPPFDKGGRGRRGQDSSLRRKQGIKIIACCPDNRNPPSDSVY